MTFRNNLFKHGILVKKQIFYSEAPEAVNIIVVFRLNIFYHRFRKKTQR